MQMWVDAAEYLTQEFKSPMSTAALDLTSPENRDSDRPVSQSEFPRSVNWANPRVAAILETAAACFSKGGFSTTTLADIGKELGLRKSIVHYYFTSKATLVREVQSYAYGRYLDVIRSTLLGERPSEAPISGMAPAGHLSAPVRRTAGLADLWAALRNENSLRGLNLELWSEGRRNPELSERAETLEAEAQKLLATHFAKVDGTAELDPEDLATLTLAVLDGLTVRQEREGNNERTTRAFETFLALLKK
jgi:AcrR family transcriptional regulator